MQLSVAAEYNESAETIQRRVSDSGRELNEYNYSAGGMKSTTEGGREYEIVDE